MKSVYAEKNIKAENKHSFEKMIRIIIPLILWSICTQAKHHEVSNISQFNEAVNTAKPGDRIIMSEGRWENVKLILQTNGTKEKNITLEAKTPGKTIICGKSMLQIAGNYLIISGLLFTDGEPISKNAIEFKNDNGDVANHSIITNCAVINFNNKDKKIRKQWIDLYGRHNSIEYCYFEGKTDLGVVLSIEIDSTKSDKNYHKIHHNYFGKRPPYNANGGEIIRVARAETQLLSSNTIIEDNYFENCDGENEIISVKSSDNIIRRNMFYESAGGVSLRHGCRNDVYENYFIGNNKAESSGVKIHQDGHKVYNNLFFRLMGNKEFSASIALICGEENPADVGMIKVTNVEICNNTFVECALPFNLGTLQPSRNLNILPENVLISGNIIYSPNSENWYIKSDIENTLNISHNLIITKNNKNFNEKNISEDLSMINCKDFFFPIAKNLFTTSPKYIKNDISGNPRKMNIVGALEKFNYSGNNLPNATNCGPLWYKK